MMIKLKNGESILASAIKSIRIGGRSTEFPLLSPRVIIDYVVSDIAMLVIVECASDASAKEYASLLYEQVSLCVNVYAPALEQDGDRENDHGDR